MAQAGGVSAGGAGAHGSAIGRLKALAGALAVTACLFIWQTLTVRYNYGGNWTALFQMGELTTLPEELLEGSHLWRNHAGYEGEEARVVAHDPLNRRGWSRYLDDPELRYTRWLMPAMANLLGGGRRGSVDKAYLAAFLFFTALGTYSLMSACGWPGLCFGLLPATLISMDRMTVNVSLAALIACALAARRKHSWPWFWVTVALAPVAHPQGWALPAAALFTGLRWKRWSQVAFAAAACAPGLAMLAVAQHMAGQRRMLIEAVLDWATPWMAFDSFVKITEKVFSPFLQGGPLLLFMGILDKTTLVALLAVAAWTLWRFRASSGRWERWACVLLVIPGGLIDAEHHLAEPFMWLNYGTPLLLLHWADTPKSMWLWRWAPLAVCSLRVGYQFGYQVLGVLRGIV